MRKDSRYNYVAVLLCAIACCSWGYVLDLKFYGFGYSGWELPLYANLMWNLCHGSMSTSLFGENFLLDHFNAIAFFLVPFYYFFQSALTLLYFKLIAFFTGSYVLYLLAARRLGGLGALALMLAYMFYPANVAMLFFEFNFESLAIPLILLIFYFFEEKKYLSFMLTCFLLTTVKENMPLVVLMIGVYGFILRKEDRLRWGLCPFLLGAGMFVGEVFLILPWAFPSAPSSNPYWYLYSNLGGSPGDIFRALIFKEPEVLRILFSSNNISFLFQLFGPLLAPALLTPQILLIASPLFLQDMLSQFTGQQSIYYYYASTLTVFIFMATVAFLGRVNTKFKAYVLFIFIVLLFVFDLGFMPQWQRRLGHLDEKKLISQVMLSHIPSDAKVVCSNKFLYMLSERKGLYVLSKHNVGISPDGAISSDADYMAVDFSRLIDFRGSLEKVLTQGAWKAQEAADEIVLLKKNTSYGQILVRSGEHSFSPEKTNSSALVVDDALKMEGFQPPVSIKFGHRTMRVTFYWEALKDDANRDLPKIYLDIFQGDRRFYSKARAPFYGLPLEKGRYYEEVFYYFIPQLSPGKYSVAVYTLTSAGRNLIRSSADYPYLKTISIVLNERP